MTPSVLWMRHGTCHDGLRHPAAHARPDSPLTAGGARGAERTARHLHHHGWRPALVTSSHLRRARHTAQIAARVVGTHLAQPEPVFAEWQAPHCVLGRSAAQYPTAYRTWRDQRASRPDSALPGGESLRRFAERAAQAATAAHRLTAEHGPVLIVSHRLLIGAVAALHLGYRDAADIFRYASDFHLTPAHLWAPNQEDHQ
jgi:broad specificity phosphatase PhoE